MPLAPASCSSSCSWLDDMVRPERENDEKLGVGTHGLTDQ